MTFQTHTYWKNVVKRFWKGPNTLGPVIGRLPITTQTKRCYTIDRCEMQSDWCRDADSEAATAEQKTEHNKQRTQQRSCTSTLIFLFGINSCTRQTRALCNTSDSYNTYSVIVGHSARFPLAADIWGPLRCHWVTPQKVEQCEVDVTFCIIDDNTFCFPFVGEYFTVTGMPSYGVYKTSKGHCNIEESDSFDCCITQFIAEFLLPHCPW